MIVRIPGYFAVEQARAIVANLAHAEGASPSGFQASDAAIKLGADFKTALEGNPVFEAASLPRRMTTFSVLRLAGDEGHGFPIDNFVVGSGAEAVRADLAMTLFLSDPASYQGGELVVLADTGSQRIKMDAGSAVLYPATNFHRVEPVTVGERWTAEAIVQSTIREDEHRQILAEINSVLTWMDEAPPEHAETLATARLSLRRARANLGRMWAEL